MEMHREWIRNDSQAQKNYKDQHPNSQRKYWRISTSNIDKDTNSQKNISNKYTQHVQPTDYSFTGTPHIPELTNSFNSYTGPQIAPNRESAYRSFESQGLNQNNSSVRNSIQTTNTQNSIQQNGYSYTIPYQYLFLPGNKDHYKEDQQEIKDLDRLYENLDLNQKFQSNYSQTNTRSYEVKQLYPINVYAPRTDSYERLIHIRYGTKRPPVGQSWTQNVESSMQNDLQNQTNKQSNQQSSQSFAYSNKTKTNSRLVGIKPFVPDSNIAPRTHSREDLKHMRYGILGRKLDYMGQIDDINNE
ncbi:MAG: hypothetical protein EZS28_002683 [Streblomastix strix]|uniref:Uncharacterized protein n=1 Tax=Streblomastix strix TaxID=222440 RepID=A0A5J4X5I9_9EUKA|nr:MAG: hypothetical protein EZS28_002683 [Streblomastix strix]